MKTWNFISTVILAFFLIFYGLIMSEISHDGTRLKQEVITLKTSLESAKNKLEKTTNDNAFLRGEIETAKIDLALSKEKIESIEGNVEKRLARVENKIFNPAEIYEKALKSIVRVEVGTKYGTGFLVGNRKQILTAYHIASSSPGTNVKVFPNDGVYSAVLGKVKRIKPEWDLAIIDLAVPLNADPLTLSDIRNLAVGDNVLAIGNPNEFNNSASVGIVNGLDRKLKSLPLVKAIQVDPSIYYGSSGGPVINRDGQVIGVISRGMSDGFPFSFIIPANYVNSFLSEE